MDPTTKEVAAYAAAISAIIGALILLWRYLFTPLGKFLKTAKANSKAIYDSLPALHAISQRWPSPSGLQSLAEDIDLLSALVELNQARLLAHLDFSKIAVFECSTTGACVYANRALCDLFEMDFADMLGNGWLEAIEPSDRLVTHEQWIAAISGGIPYEATYRVRGVRTRKRTAAAAQAFPLVDAKGEIIAYFGTVVPIDQDRPASEA